MPSSERITSPTFNLVCEYPTRSGLLVHADLYRLRDRQAAIAAEIERLGLVAARAERHILCVEWGEALDEMLGGAAELVVAIALDLATGERSVRLSGKRASGVLARLGP